MNNRNPFLGRGPIPFASQARDGVHSLPQSYPGLPASFGAPLGDLGGVASSQLVSSSPHAKNILEVPATVRPLANAPQMMRGRTETITPGVTAQKLSMVELRPGDADAEVIALILQRRWAADSPSASIDVDIKAELEWGTGGAQFTALCDWPLGMILALPTSFLSVRALVPAQFNASPKMILSAAFAYGAGPQLNRVKLTSSLGSLADGAEVAVDIPPFATGCSLLTQQTVSGLPAFPMLVRFAQNASVAATLGALTYGTSSNDGWHVPGSFALPGGAGAVYVRNDSGVDASVSVLWDLCF